MPFEQLLAAIEGTAFSTMMRESVYAFPMAESLHVAALALVVGSIGMIDLRLLGLSARNLAVTQLSREILPWTWGAFALAATTGLMMFVSRATSYVENVAFLIKMALLVCAALNMLVFHLFTAKGVARWDRSEAIPAGAKVAGALSLLLWILVVAFGRWIGFVV